MSLRDALQVEWAALQAELDCLAEEGRVASFWWRDDDASDVTPALERLLALQLHTGTPLAVAVVPKVATAALSDRLNALPGVTIVQHGFAHVNHALAGEKKSEFPASRPLQQRIDDLCAGRVLMKDRFPGHLPMLVPPWNRIADMAGDVASAGFIALSGFKLRRQPYAAAGLIQANTHIDPVDWRGGSIISGCSSALRDAVSLLQALRTHAALQQAIGLLTHHLRHDEDTWGFIAALLELIRNHPGACWVPAGQALTVGVPAAA